MYPLIDQVYATRVFEPTKVKDDGEQRTLKLQSHYSLSVEESMTRKTFASKIRRTMYIYTETHVSMFCEGSIYTDS